MLDSCISGFIEYISEEYNIPIDDVKDKWKSAETDFQKVWDSSYLLYLDPEKKKRKEIVRDQVKGCQAILKSGKNMGEKCGFRSTPKSNYTLCGKHKIKNPDSIIRKNEYGNFEHKGTRMVFEDGIVIGKQGYIGSDSGKILPLTKEDKKICRKKKFIYYREIIFDDDEITIKI